MKKTILLIDDCDMMRRFLTPVFKDDFNVVSIHNPNDAYNWLQENPSPDVIILDYELPEMNGLSLLQKLRAQPTWSEIPVIMLSGVKDAEKRWQCLEAGADDFLTKPFHPKELALRVKLICNRIPQAHAAA
jgi:DNA-binding response OmpR family regulator